jgi:hypothetical protein
MSILPQRSAIGASSMNIQRLFTPRSAKTGADRWHRLQPVRFSDAGKAKPHRLKPVPPKAASHFSAMRFVQITKENNPIQHP